MHRTQIQWTEFATNPILARRRGLTAARVGYASGVGHYCEKIGPGCKNCYASKMQPRFGLPQFQEQRNDEIETFLDVSKLLAVLKHRTPAKIFWCDMTDMFGRWVPNKWIAAIFGVMAATPQHTHQVLTKRADRLPEWFGWIGGLVGPDGSEAPCNAVMGCMAQAARYPELLAAMTAANQQPTPRWPLPNVHLGVSVENQATADERIPHLMRTPAAIHWVSAEPLLEAVDLSRWLMPREERDRRQGDAYWKFTRQAKAPPPSVADPEAYSPLLDWGVIGGESGKKAREFDVAWARSFIDQFQAAGRSPFVKQLGANPFGRNDEGQVVPFKLYDGHGGDPDEWPADLRVRESADRQLVRP